MNTATVGLTGHQYLHCTVSYSLKDNATKNITVFSKRELTFTFAICCRPSVCLSVVCNVRAPYSGGSSFRQYFYGIITLVIHWHPLEISQRSS